MIRNLRYVLMAVVLVTFVSGLAFDVSAQRGKSREEIEAEIRRLERQRMEEQQERQRRAERDRPTGADLNAIIVRYERLFEQQCAEGTSRRNDRCAEVMFTLGALYHDQARDSFGQSVEQFSRDLEAFERTGRGTPPVHPIPDYGKSLRMYWRLTREFPQFPRLPEAFNQMGTIYLVAGHLDTARIIWEQLVQRFPNSPRVSGAHFRLADLAFMDNQFARAYDHLRRVQRNQIDPISWEMTHYRKGECAYNVGDYDKAVDYFHGYVVECDRGSFQRCEFREMALEFMAISFSEMADGTGVNEAIKFFQKHPNRPYEAQVIYRIGAKNRERAQWVAAIQALEGALQKFPLYKEAPIARHMLIESLVAQREPRRANEERERLVDDYGPGSAWFQANSREREVIDRANVEIRRSLGNIAIYYHGEAQRTRDRALYDKALKRYYEFFQKFPNDKWRVFEYRYNAAEIYSQLGNFEKAAEYYEFVAAQDLTTFPTFVADIDTLGMDPEELERMKAGIGDRTNPIAISQEDAGFNAIVALDNARKREMAREELDDARAYALPATRRLIEQVASFQRRFPQSANAGEVLYLAGNLHFSGKAYNDAIAAFRTVVEQYPQSKVVNAAARMLGNSYSSAGQFDLAMQTFKNLLGRTTDEKERGEITELAAAAMYRRAETLRDAGNRMGAADAFRAIAGEFPDSRVAEHGWFEAGVMYEQENQFERAATNFLQLTERFPRSTLREDAFIRSAGNFKKAEMWEKAAQTYLTAANTIPKAEFAIPSLSAASEAYQRMNQFDMAGRMFELIFERYRNDPQTPQALNNAGLIFEKGNHYNDAIKVYELLATNFPNSPFAGEAYFSIGLCWEKLGEYGRMANAFADYARKFTNDRQKQVQALVKAGEAFFNMQNFREAEASYNQAIRIFEQHRATSDFDVANIAQAYYRLGDIAYKRFEAIKLDGRNEREMATRMRDKTAALEHPARFFAEAIRMGVQEWTMRATYMIGRGFYDMAEAVANQRLFGNEIEQMGGKIRILMSLDRYYDRAMEYFGQNITWAKDQNLTGEYIDMSMQAMMEMAFKKGDILEQVGILFKNSPVPPMSEEEREFYVMELEERYLAAIDAAMPIYETGMQLARDIGVGPSEWVDRIRARLREINPESDYVDLQIVKWVPTEAPVQYDEHGNRIAARPRDDAFDRNMRRIQNIMGMEISVEDKIRQLERIRTDTEREIVLEEERINRLRAGS
jgi:tetratricopeptide (TPR) repeat protein